MTARRPRSIEVPGVNHGNVPIPMGARVGNILFSSGIAGKDPATNKVAEDATQQARFAFQNMRTLLANGGATLEDVVRVTVFVKDESVRDAINAEWIACFPDPKDRPARHTLVHELRNNMLLQLEVFAVVQEREAQS
jgi:2-iminobutanoate/2-iminopropanoate deaminase